jgi:hypothetical protein
MMPGASVPAESLPMRRHRVGGVPVSWHAG